MQSAPSLSLSCLLSVALLALPVAAARADVLADLDATLKGLQADTPVKGVMEVTSRSIEDGADPQKPALGHLELEIAAGDGLTVHMSPALLQQIEAEELRVAADPDQKQATVDLLRSVGPTRVGHMLAAADALRVMLDGASEPAVKAAILDSASVTELSVHLPMRLSKKDSDSAKDYRDEAVIWLDAHGVPLQSEETMHAKFCKFFLCVSVDRRQDITLRVINGRLVAVKTEEELKQSGLGQGSQTRTTITLALQ